MPPSWILFLSLVAAFALGCEPQNVRNAQSVEIPYEQLHQATRQALDTAIYIEMGRYIEHTRSAQEWIKQNPDRVAKACTGDADACADAFLKMAVGTWLIESGYRERRNKLFQAHEKADLLRLAGHSTFSPEDQLQLLEGIEFISGVLQTSRDEAQTAGVPLPGAIDLARQVLRRTADKASRRQ